MSTHPEFDEILSAYTPNVQAIARAARDLIHDVLPATVEVAWVRQRTVGYGTGPKKMSEHFSWLQPNKAHVILGFNYGSELPDPAGLLEGTGELFRHVKLRSVEDVRKPALRALLEFAVTHRVPPPKQAR